MSRNYKQGPRTVGGQKATCGRREPKKGCDDASLSKDEQEILRRAAHDIGRICGERMRRPRHVRHLDDRGKQVGEDRPKRRRHAPGSWQANFLRAYARCGDMKDAARLSGVPYASVRTSFQAQSDFRRACLDALSEWSGRMLERCARGQIRSKGGKRRPWKLFPRQAKALMHMMEKKLLALAIGGAEIERDGRGL